MHKKTVLYKCCIDKDINYIQNKTALVITQKILNVFQPWTSESVNYSVNHDDVWVWALQILHMNALVNWTMSDLNSSIIRCISLYWDIPSCAVQVNVLFCVMLLHNNIIMLNAIKINKIMTSMMPLYSFFHYLHEV